jgi:hypothetical protein
MTMHTAAGATPAQTTAMTPQLAKRRYLVGFSISMSIYVVLVFGVSLAIKRLGIEGPLLYALAVLPSLPLVYSIYVMGRYLMEMDEYQRAMQTRRMLAGLGATLAVCSVWGFLEVFAKTPRLDLYLVYPIFSFFWGFSCIFIRTVK